MLAMIEVRYIQFTLGGASTTTVLFAGTPRLVSISGRLADIDMQVGYRVRFRRDHNRMWYHGAMGTTVVCRFVRDMNIPAAIPMTLLLSIPCRQVTLILTFPIGKHFE